MIKPALAILFGLLFAQPALAAADLDVDVSAPAGVKVYDVARYTVDVANIGNRTARNVTVTIDLPTTNTSPTVHIMGDLDGFASACTQNGFTLQCNLGRIRRGRSASAWLDIALPASAADIEIIATASTTSNENSLANNTEIHVAALDAYATPITGPVDVINQHCTGQGLTAFYECAVTPGSIMSHAARYNADGTITITNPANSTVTGTWTQPTTDSLEFEYVDNGQVVANFSGVGVGGDCFEGLTTFPNSPWVAPYEICLQ